MQEIKLQVSERFYNQLERGLKRGMILPNAGNYKNLKVGDSLTVSCDAFATNDGLDMQVKQVYYFETVPEALDMMGKQKLGYPSKLTSTEIEDRLLAIYGSKGIFGNGVLVLEVSKQK